MEAAEGAGISRDRRGRFVLYPIAEIFHAVPVWILDADADDTVIGATVRRALETMVDADTALDAHRAELRRLGLTLSELDSSPSAGVHVRRKRLELEGWRSDGLPSGEELRLSSRTTDDAIGAAVRRLVGTDAATTEGPVGATFGYKVAWLAFRGSDPAAVAEALGLVRTEAVDWEAGVDRASAGDAVFVSPRTGGWVFALHLGWHDEPPDIAALSDLLGTEVQHFATHRVVEAHAWARAERGHVTRAFRSVGETGETSASGEPTEVERRVDLEFPDEQSVLQVAAAWSIDPRSLGRVPSESETGILGFLPTG